MSLEVLQVCTIALEPYRHNFCDWQLSIGVLHMQVCCCIIMT
jgi:hypothetical protein